MESARECNKIWEEFQLDELRNLISDYEEDHSGDEGLVNAAYGVWESLIEVRDLLIIQAEKAEEARQEG